MYVYIYIYIYIDVCIYLYISLSIYIYIYICTCYHNTISLTIQQLIPTPKKAAQLDPTPSNHTTTI